SGPRHDRHHRRHLHRGEGWGTEGRGPGHHRGGGRRCPEAGLGRHGTQHAEDPLMDLQLQPHHGPSMAAAPEPLIRLQEIVKIYRAGEVEVTALRGVSLEVGEGEFIAVMGSSGSGKSTLMNILGCLDRPTSGGYFLEGREVSRLSRDALAEIRGRTLG